MVRQSSASVVTEGETGLVDDRRFMPTAVLVAQPNSGDHIAVTMIIGSKQRSILGLGNMLNDVSDS